MSAALEYMQQADIYEIFNQACHWLFIVIAVNFPAKLLNIWQKLFIKKGLLIIQWDLMYSVENFVFYFKQTGLSSFTSLQMNSASLFKTETELIIELSKQGSFQLQLLLNALILGIGGQFNEGALDLLNVSLDVKQEIDTWRFID